MGTTHSIRGALQKPKKIIPESIHGRDAEHTQTVIKEVCDGVEHQRQTTIQAYLKRDLLIFAHKAAGC